jgi:hypothetical protein
MPRLVLFEAEVSMQSDVDKGEGGGAYSEAMSMSATDPLEEILNTLWPACKLKWRCFCVSRSVFTTYLLRLFPQVKFPDS